MPFTRIGATTMKIIKSTRQTSTSGVTLMSDCSDVADVTRIPSSSCALDTGRRAIATAGLPHPPPATRHPLPQLPHQKSEDLGLVVDLLFQRLAARVAAGDVVAEKHWIARAGVRLHHRGHLARMQRRDAGIGVAADEQHRW